MTVVVVLHLVGEALREGRLVGRAELPRSGRRATIRSARDVVTLASTDSGDSSTTIGSVEEPS